MPSLVPWARRLSRRPFVEALEDRLLLTAYAVNTTNDILGDSTPGEVTLRDALTAIDTQAASGNAPAGTASNTITFAIGAVGAIQTINVGSGNVAGPLPAITHQVAIDGRSQGGPGYGGPPLIALNGSSAGPDAVGLELDPGSDGSTADSLVIQQFGGDGIELLGTSRNVLVGNYVGTDVSGTEPSGNGHDGIFLGAGAAANTVGATASPQGLPVANVISANGAHGVEIADRGTSANVVLGNLIGTDVNGTANLGNLRDGVFINNGATANTVGGTAFSAGNLITANGGNGVEVSDAGTGKNAVLGNFVGTDVNGTGLIANGNDGVLLTSGATANTVGGNVLSANGVYGVEVNGASNNLVLGNKIGTDKGGTAPLGNAAGGVVILGGATANTVGGTATGGANGIAANGGQGVWLSGGGTSANLVLGNMIGTDVGGTAALGNTADGVLIDAGATANTVGAGNVISANDNNGVEINGASGNVVRGNRIGIDAGGAAALGNLFSGILLTAGATRNTVGGTAAAAANVLSANALDGVDVEGPGTSGNVVLGNRIGTDAGGATALGNGADGVFLGLAATANTVGGTAAGAGNVISGNTSNGVFFSDLGATKNAVLGNLIGTDGTGAGRVGNGHDGVLISFGAAGETVGGNVIAASPNSGVEIGSSGNVVSGNLIGTDKNGTANLGNAGNGVALLNGATANTIGGLGRGAGNVISANGLGINITDAGTSGNVVLGNLIGTDKNGTARLGNGIYGVAISFGASANTLGGTAAGAGNVISANGSSGVEITGASNNVLRGNRIGTDRTGTGNLGNGQSGVLLSFGATGNTVGGTAAGSGNTIAFGARGVVVGSDPSDTGTVHNSVLGNSIFANSQLGIDLGNDGLTANGANPRNFPNDGQNAPVLTSVGPAGVFGSLSSAARTTFRLEFFASPAAGPASQGKVFLGFVNVTTNGAGTVAFTAPVAAIPAGSLVTATATNLRTGDTSEFSRVGTQLLLLSSPVIPFSQAAQSVSLSAQLFTGSEPVSGARVTFTIAGLPGRVTGTTNRSGVVVVTFVVPGGTRPGAYLITASYAGTEPALTSEGLLTIVAPPGSIGRRWRR
jgi:hypothetical protein